MAKEMILQPDPARVMEGLRDTGYNFNTAVADIIDNSITAEAENIKVIVDVAPNETIKLLIADDGYGMDHDGLINAMKYGSAAKTDQFGLGKFGLGLKTASTAFCRCLSVISRGEDMILRKVQWDLDHIAKKGEWNLLLPDITDDEKDDFEDAVGEGKGTLVIWDKIDRLITVQTKTARMKAYNRIIESLKFHISMVYQRFLDEKDSRARNVNIFLNGEKVLPWDPFCMDEKDTKILYEKAEEIGVVGRKDKTYLMVRAVVIPRKEDFSTPEKAKEARVSNDMQGFYIYRENRLIHYGGWMGMFSKEPHGTLLRVELSFNHFLDDAFQVDIKKSRIILDETIFDHIKDNILPGPRRAADERYRKGTVTKVVEATAGAHESSSANIEEKAKNLEDSHVEVKNEETGEVEVTNINGTFPYTLTIHHTDKPDLCRVIPVENLAGSVLWAPTIADGKKAVEINMSHPYYQKVYFPVLKERVMVTGMDALLWALAEAELSTFNEHTKDQYEDMRYKVSRDLKKLLDDLPEPNVDEDE